MAPKKDASAVLSSAHSHSYVSQSGLAAVLKSVKEHGLPKGTSRASIKRAREAALPSDLWMDCQAAMADKRTHDLCLCHPVKLLQYMVSEIDAFAHFFAGKLAERPSTAEDPWGIALYSDEIVPGNALKPRNDRKLVAVYWSFCELESATGHEDLWWHVAAARSSVVRGMQDGWAQLFKKACQSFFASPLDVSQGVLLNIKGHGLRMFFAKIGRVVADEPALKGCLSTKGASGCWLSGEAPEGLCGMQSGPDLQEARRQLPVLNEYGDRIATGDATCHGGGAASSLRIAKEKEVKSLGFALLSAGIFRGDRPLCKILEIACEAVKENVYEGGQQGCTPTRCSAM
eukprot:Skav208656  [mRNA]  locus=scaffold357:18137:34262:- [translate_table: standard]